MNNNQIYSYANTQQAEQEKENKLASLLTPENIQMAIQLGSVGVQLLKKAAPAGPWQALSPSASLAASSGFWAETMWASASIIGENSQLLGRHKKALVWHTACQTRAFCYAVLGDVTPYTPALPSRRNQKPQRSWWGRTCRFRP